jgi:hypothetical protein
MQVSDLVLVHFLQLIHSKLMEAHATKYVCLRQFRSHIEKCLDKKNENTNKLVKVAHKPCHNNTFHGLNLIMELKKQNCLSKKLHP